MKFLSNFAILIASIALTVLLFLAIDFSISPRFIPYFDGVWEDRVNPYLSDDDGWYELKKSFNGKGHWGNHIYDVNTNQLGFRSENVDDLTDQAEYIFLGDSFTFGVNGRYADTFVGMFSKAVKNNGVLNAGVPSYSPTIYLHQYKKALNANSLKKHHKVIIALDISDIQDEAACWTDGKEHPIKLNGPCKPSKTEVSSLSFWKKINNRLRFTRSIIQLIDMRFRPERYGVTVHDSVFNQARSGFTWQSWRDLNKNDYPDGYLPNGVVGGMARIDAKVAAIVNLAQKHEAEVYLLAYPWPAQLKYPQKFNYQEWVNKICKKNTCAGVIDTFPEFNKGAGSDFYSQYYLQGDIHFNKDGNLVIANKLVNYFSQVNKLSK